jgi:hypothetical protein
MPVSEGEKTGVLENREWDEEGRSREEEGVAGNIEPAFAKATEGWRPTSNEFQENVELPISNAQ